MAKMKNLNLGFRICFEIRYSYFQFMIRIWNDYKRTLPASPSHITLSLLLLVSCVGCQPDSKHHDPLSLTATLVELLQDSSPDVRRTAALSLGKIGHSAGTQGLVQALSDSDPLVREYSAWALGQIGEEVNTDAAMALVSALGDEQQSVKNTAAKALGNVGLREPMVPLLVEGLTVGEVQSRRAVVQALMQLEGKDAYAALITALKDADPQVRQGTIAALGELGDRQVLPKFRKILLNDRNVGVRTEAAYRLGKLGDQADLPALQKAAKEDTTPLVHLWTTWAIENLSPNSNAMDSESSGK